MTTNASSHSPTRLEDRDIPRSVSTPRTVVPVLRVRLRESGSEFYSPEPEAYAL